MRRVPLRHDAGVHHQPAVRAAGHALLAQPVEPAPRDPARRGCRRACRRRVRRAHAVRRPPAGAGRGCRAGRWRRRRARAGAQRGERLRPAVDEVAEQVEAVARGREIDLGEQPVAARRNSPAGRRPGSSCTRFCYALRLPRFAVCAPLVRSAPPWTSRCSLFLIILNGLFAMSEMALTASRKARLQVMLEAGERGAQAAIDAARQPDQVPVDGADRHHLDRHPERHRRRGRVLGSRSRAGCSDLRHRRARGRASPPPRWWC